nr:hypothetical protein [uncultured Desulfobulbus sp.]
MLALLLLCVLLFLPLLPLHQRLTSPHFEQLVCAWISCMLVFLVWVANGLLKRIWCLAGKEVLTSEAQLRHRLLEVNTIACPVRAVEKRKKILFSWRYNDIAWCGMISRMGMKRLYELRCRFDATTRTVYLVDRYRYIDFLVCPDRVKTGFARICLPLLRTSSSYLKSTDQYNTLEPHGYDFLPAEIKAPVIGTIINNGWKVRFSLF